MSLNSYYEKIKCLLSINDVTRFDVLLNNIRIRKHIISNKHTKNVYFYSGSIFKFADNAKIILRNADLHFGHGRISKNDYCSKIILEDNSKLIVVKSVMKLNKLSMKIIIQSIRLSFSIIELLIFVKNQKHYIIL